MNMVTRTDTQSPALQVADGHDVIRVHGARVNNLKDVSVEIPKRRLTVFTGVSGSGKSSLVFGTIAAESQRLINETYSAFVQGFMPTLARPEVDVLEGLTTAIIVDQERMGADARSTVGTATDANAMLRILFSRLGRPHIGSPNAFSFNVAVGPGERCDHRRARCQHDREKDLHPRRRHVSALRGPGLGHRLRPVSAVRRQQVAQRGCAHDPRLQRRRLVRPHLPRLRLLRPGQADPQVHQDRAPRLALQGADQDQGRRRQPDVRGPDPRESRSRSCPRTSTRCSRTSAPSWSGRSPSPPAPSAAAPGSARRPGRRGSTGSTSPTPARCRSATSPSGCADWTNRPWRRCWRRCGETLDSFVEIGLGYLSLDRPSGTLSGGEAQRVKMIRHLGSSLTDVTYVFDEPTIGLHPHDIQRMNDLLLQLRDKGNTVLVVEHKPEAIAIADHVVDLGPGAGTAGGEVVFEGTVEGLRASGTLTGRHLDDRASLKPSVRTPSGVLEVRGASTHNLQDVDVDIPLGVLVVVTGVAGSGKSSLIHGSVSGRDGVVSVDQAPIRGSRRSNPATYTGLLDPIRTAFAKANGVKPALFSANSEGACPNCNGAGVIYTDLAMMAGVATTCEECEGKRFQASVLEYHLGGRDISEVLAMSVTEAEEFFGAGEARTPAACKVLDRLADVGLGYLSLGQPLTTLSGGERQRLKLATHMAEKGRRLRPRRADHRPAPRRRRAAARPARPARRLRQVGHRHRAPPGGHGARRLDHRPRPRRRPRRRPDRLRGHTRRPRRRPLHPHRRAPRGLRRHLTEAHADTVRRVSVSHLFRPVARAHPPEPARHGRARDRMNARTRGARVPRCPDVERALLAAVRATYGETPYAPVTRRIGGEGAAAPRRPVGDRGLHGGRMLVARLVRARFTELS